MPLPDKLYKWTQPGGICWNGCRIQVGLETECPYWELSRDMPGDGFGIGVCSDPLEALEYLPPSLYTELYQVDSLGETQEIRPGFWRCQTVFPRRLIPREQQVQFNSDRFVISVDPDNWIEVGHGIRGYGFEDGRIQASGGIVRAFDRTLVYASGNVCVECHDDARVVGVGRTFVFRRGSEEPSLYDRSQGLVLA